MELQGEEGGPAPAPRKRNANWSRDETILLMDLYLSAPRAEKRHPEVVALSAVLRAAGRGDGRAVLPSFRNPAGIAMRLRNFGRHDPAAPAGRYAGLRAGGAVDLKVWQEFAGKPSVLAAEVARIRRAIALQRWAPIARSSHGPTPSFGTRTSKSLDVRTSVYLLLIDAPIEILAPTHVPDPARAVVKIGRTSDIARRMAELACGLPPGAGIRYIPIWLREFGSATAAHRFERHLLDQCDREGWAMGGEFAYAPLAALKAALFARGASHAGL